MPSHPPPSQSDFPHAPQASPRHTILVVEDECLVRMDVAHEFRRHGFSVFEAPDTDKALDLLQGEAIDLLFTDIRLPGAMDGLALAKFVQAALPEMKVVIASGGDPPEGNVMIADACFSKPYDFVHIVAVVRKLLADRERPGCRSGAPRSPARRLPRRSSGGCNPA